MEYLTLILFLVLLSLWFVGSEAIVWMPLLAVTLFLGTDLGLLFWVIYIPINVVILMPSFRKDLVSKPLVGLINKLGLMPKISETEKTALRAGTIWVDGEFFSGKPSFDAIFKEV